MGDLEELAGRREEIKGVRASKEQLRDIKWLAKQLRSQYTGGAGLRPDDRRYIKLTAQVRRLYDIFEDAASLARYLVLTDETKMWRDEPGQAGGGHSLGVPVVRMVQRDREEFLSRDAEATRKYVADLRESACHRCALCHEEGIPRPWTRQADRQLETLVMKADLREVDLLEALLQAVGDTASRQTDGSCLTTQDEACATLDT